MIYQAGFGVPLKQIEYRVYGDLSILYPKHLLKGVYSLREGISKGFLDLELKVRVSGRFVINWVRAGAFRV